jgi:N-acyl-phosphatidylethanolamine-hydrolysing phospholipase D
VTRWAFSMFHVNPEDAVEIHMEVKSRKSVGMHYGTWILTCEEVSSLPYCKLC